MRQDNAQGFDRKHRLLEMPVWLGVPILGFVFSGSNISAQRFLLLCLSSSCVILHMLFFNDWGELKSLEVNKPRRALLLRVSIALLLFGLLFQSVLLPFKTLITLYLLGIIFSVLYSHPAFNLKESMAWSKILHILGIEILFVMGFAAFSPDLKRSVLVGLFFSFLFTSGHFVHECIDKDEDERNCCQSWATKIGVRKTFIAAITLFFISNSYLFWLLVIGAVGKVAFIMFTLPFIIHLKYLIKFNTISNFEVKTFKFYRREYRAAYASIVFICVVLKMFNVTL